jgi:putative transposase
MIPIEFLEELTWFLNLVMQLEAMEQIDAEPYERADSRKAHRNGYKERTLKTRVGELTLKKPQFREMPFQTKIFDRYSRVEKALINAIVESYFKESRPDESRISFLGWESKSCPPQVSPGSPRSWMRGSRTSSRNLSNSRSIISLWMPAILK